MFREDKTTYQIFLLASSDLKVGVQIIIKMQRASTSLDVESFGPNKCFFWHMVCIRVLRFSSWSDKMRPQPLDIWGAWAGKTSGPVAGYLLQTCEAWPQVKLTIGQSQSLSWAQKYHSSNCVPHQSHAVDAQYIRTCLLVKNLMTAEICSTSAVWCKLKFDQHLNDELISILMTSLFIYIFVQLFYIAGVHKSDQAYTSL